MSNAQEMRKKLIEARDNRGWDNKDWHRATGIDQRVLEAIDQGKLDLTRPEAEGLADVIMQGTQNNELPDLLRFDKPQVIAFEIHKGGAGKTTLSTNIGCELGQRGYNVLLIDADAQGDSTSTILASKKGALEKSKELNLYECLNSDYSEMDIRKHIISSDYDGLDCVASKTNLTRMDVILSAMPFREKLFAHCLEELNKENYYDFVLIDMDKNLNIFNSAILCGCDYIMIPSETEYYNLKGIVVMQAQIANVQEYNKNLKMLGIVFNKVDLRKKSVEEAKEAMNKQFEGYVFENILRVDANIGNSQYEGTPVMVFNKSCRASQQIRAITDEMLLRIKKGKEM